MVDWRSTVSDYLASVSFAKLNSPDSCIATATRVNCGEIDWPTFAEEWRNGYKSFTRTLASLSKIAPGDFKNVDEHHLSSLRALLEKYGISDLWEDADVVEISRIWHSLNGWPDSSRGLKNLRDKGFIVCALSNGNQELLQDMAEYADLPWKHIFSADLFRAYKPNPEVYFRACEELNLEPEECAMVAAHLHDLRAAKECGMQTIYIERAGEEQWAAGGVSEAKKEGWVDMWVDKDENVVGGGIIELMRKFEAGRKL